jgi:hypothetical protein
MSEEPKGWKERHFFNLNINPKEANMPDDPASTLFNLETNPAAYPEPEPGEAPTTPKNKEEPVVEGALPAPETMPGVAAEPFGDRPPNPADPTAPPVQPPTVPMPGAPTQPVPEAAQEEVREN